METKKLKLVVTERETVDGRKFNTYKTFSKNGRATEVKFRKEVTNIPTKTCYINVAYDDMNIVTSNEYPTLWIKAIHSVEESGVENPEVNKAKLIEYFGE